MKLYWAVEHAVYLFRYETVLDAQLEISCLKRKYGKDTVWDELKKFDLTYFEIKKLSNIMER